MEAMQGSERMLTPQCTTPNSTLPPGRPSSLHGPCESRHPITPLSELTCRILLLGLIGSFAQHYLHHIDVSCSPPSRCGPR
jgi:hypothetical protein